jgi:hypothetical protein
VVEAVIGEAPAHLVKEIVPLAERVQKIGQLPDTGVAGGFQARHPGVEHFGQVDVERLVRAEGREDFGFQARGRDGLVRQARSSVGSSVVHTALTRNFRRMPCARSSSVPSSALARSHMRRALDSSSSSSMPK